MELSSEAIEKIVEKHERIVKYKDLFISLAFLFLIISCLGIIFTDPNIYNLIAIIIGIILSISFFIIYNVQIKKAIGINFIYIYKASEQLKKNKYTKAYNYLVRYIYLKNKKLIKEKIDSAIDKFKYIVLLKDKEDETIKYINKAVNNLLNYEGIQIGPYSTDEKKKGIGSSARLFVKTTEEFYDRDEVNKNLSLPFWIAYYTLINYIVLIIALYATLFITHYTVALYFTKTLGLPMDSRITWGIIYLTPAVLLILKGYYDFYQFNKSKN